MKRIGLKLWSAMMLLVAIVLLLLWLFQIVFLEQFYEKIKISELITNGKDIVTELKKEGSLINGINKKELSETMEDMAYTMQLSLEVIDSYGNLVYEADNSNTTMSRGMKMNVNNAVYDTVLKGETAKLEAVHPRFGSRYMLIGIPIIAEDEVIGALILNVPMAPVQATVGILKKQLFWITLLLLAVSTLIALRLSKSFTKPILSIHQAAESYSRGEFDTRVKVDRKDELGQLAVRINKMGEELAKNDQLRKDLIANVSHELRTPLSLIRGYAEALRDVTGEDPDKREKQLGVIIDETERLSFIVGDILNLSQYQAGVILLDQKTFSLKQMLYSVMARYDEKQIHRKISLEGLSEDEMPVIADRERIEQVMFNFISNAINHTLAGGSIILRVTALTNTVKIEVIDDGEGMEAEELPQVFERYYKGKKDGRSRNGSTGLGLAIVKSILQMHEVPFGVQSFVGIGTNFWFELNRDKSHTSF